MAKSGGKVEVIEVILVLCNFHGLLRAFFPPAFFSKVHKVLNVRFYLREVLLT